MQSATVQSRASGVVPFKGTRRAGGRRANRAVPRVVAAATAEAEDIGAIFRSALSTPVATPAPATPPAAAVTVDPVPGTELLRSAPAPQPPPAPTQGMDFVLEQLQNKPPGFEGAAAPAKAAAEAAAKPLADSLGDAGAAATKGLSSAADSLASALGGAAGAAGDVGAATQEAAAAAQEAAAAAAAAAKAAAEQLTSGLGGAASGAAGGAADAAQRFLEGAASEFSTEVSIIKGNIDSLVGGIQAAVGDAVGGVTSSVSSATGGAASAVGAQVSAAAQAVSGLLPPEAQEALRTAGSAVGAALEQASGVDGTTAAVVAGLGLGLPGLAAWKAAYGGFAGLLTPQEAFEVLQTQDAVLIDVRPEALRAANGTAELRRGALGKGAAIPPVALLPSIARRVRDAGAVALEIQALEVAALSKVRPGSKVIVMDQGGESAKTVARALRSVGLRRAYVMAGGFKAWSAAGLAVRESSEYDASALDAVGDLTETVAEQAASQLSSLKEPSKAATLAAALGGIGFLALNFHTTLQFLGVLGLELTLVGRAMAYDSPQEALDDMAALWNGVTNLATLPTKAAAAFSSKAGQQQAAGKGEA